MSLHRRDLSISESSTGSLVEHDVPSSPRYVSPPSHRSWSIILIPYRVCIRLVTACLALAVGGFLAYTIIIRDSTADSRYLDGEGKNVMAWPQRVDMQPTIILLAVAGVSFLFDLVSLVMSCAEIQRGSNLAVWLGSLSLLACSAAWMTAAMYAKTWASSDSTTSDTWTWSCAHQDTDLNYGNESVSFGTLCQYMDFVFCGGIVIAVLQLISMALFLIVQKDRRDQKKRIRRNTFAKKHILGDLDDDRSQSGQDWLMVRNPVTG